MRHSLTLIIVLGLCAFTAKAEDSAKVAKDILNMHGELSEAYIELESHFSEARKLTTEIFKPSLTIHSVSDVTHLEQELYDDVQASRLYILEYDVFTHSIATDLASILTLEELLELRELTKSPIFKKLSQLDEETMFSTKRFIEHWQQQNIELVEQFTKRQDEIFELKRQIMRTRLDSEQEPSE